MNEMSQVVPELGGSAVLAVYVVQWLKNSRLFGFINKDTDTLNKFVALCMALATNAGIQVSIHGAPQGGYDIAAHMPALPELVHFLLGTALSWGAQKAYYHGIVKQDGAPQQQLQVLSQIANALRPPADDGAKQAEIARLKARLGELGGS